MLLASATYLAEAFFPGLLCSHLESKRLSAESKKPDRFYFANAFIEKCLIIDQAFSFHKNFTAYSGAMKNSFI